MIKSFEIWLANKIHGGNPENIQDFLPDHSVSDEKKVVKKDQGKDIPEVDLIQQIENPNQIGEMVENEAKSGILGLFLGTILKVLQKINEDTLQDSK